MTPALCTACREPLPLPEPARTSLIVVVAFAAGVLAYGYMQDRALEGMACFPEKYGQVER